MKFVKDVGAFLKLAFVWLPVHILTHRDGAWNKHK